MARVPQRAVCIIQSSKRCTITALDKYLTAAKEGKVCARMVQCRRPHCFPMQYWRLGYGLIVMFICCCFFFYGNGDRTQDFARHVWCCCRPSYLCFKTLFLFCGDYFPGFLLALLLDPWLCSQKLPQCHPLISLHAPTFHEVLRIYGFNNSCYTLASQADIGSWVSRLLFLSTLSYTYEISPLGCPISCQNLQALTPKLIISLAPLLLIPSLTRPPPFPSYCLPSGFLLRAVSHHSGFSRPLIACIIFPLR